MHPCPKPGQLIAKRYKVIDNVGEGGQAYGLKARDRSGRQIVFIKMLKVSSRDADYAASVARFKREAGVSLTSPVAVNPLAYVEEGDRHYIVFPWVEGKTLERHVQDCRGRLSIDEVLRVLRCLIEVLAEAHGKGLIHRDIKPENIIIQRDGSVRLVDWGIAKCTTSMTIANPDDVVGTYAYMSPDHILAPDEVDARSDLYCVGGVLWYTLTGDAPASGKTVVEVGFSVCESVLPPLTDIDPAIPQYLSDAFVKLTQKDPARRFQSAEELRNALDRQEVIDHRCHSCGAPLPGGARFCTSCGRPSCPKRSAPLCLACGALTDQSGVCPGCRRTFGAVEHTFDLLNGAWRGRRLRAPEGSCRVGRNELDAADPRVSRSHTEVDCRNGTVQVQDLGSVNGTFVDGRPATQPTLLVSGQIIVFGPISVRYTRKEHHR